MNLQNRMLKENVIFRLMGRLILLSVVIGFLLRIVLLFSPRTVLSFTIAEWLKIFGVGLINDVAFAVLLLVPLFVMGLGFIERKYARPYGAIIELLLIAAVMYVFFLPSVFNEYGGGAPKIAKILFTYKLVSFSLRLFLPQIREVWRTWEVRIVFFLYVFTLLFNFISEYCFWDEFGVRYNFIAVDYLVYTTEVIGNIFASYPMIPIIIGVSLCSVFLTWLFMRRSSHSLLNIWNVKRYAVYVGGYAAAVVVCALVLSHNTKPIGGANVFAEELSSNGIYKFYLAFVNNELKYDQFYPLLPEKECRGEINRLRAENSNGVKQKNGKDEKLNIVVITVESLSATFLKDYGNKENLTPNLDTLMTKSLVFDNLYAVGTRTVRGLEALSLCLPPSSGESIIKRKNNSGLYSVGRLLGKAGYRTQFLYGGDSYFDNMKTFFKGNGYEVIDKHNFKSSEIRFANIWGVCDEDAYAKLLQVADDDARSGQPFFVNLMTISNHRPYTFPAGKITLPGGTKSRSGGVKYTDYAIGQFLKAARSKPWFGRTVFIIVADHCASSAGATDIPVEDYHIPALIYSPSHVPPQRVSKLCSQIDIMPTVLSLLSFSANTHFMGNNVLSPTFRSRAFMTTYQDMGCLEDSLLTILSPVRRMNQYVVKRLPDGTFSETKLSHPHPDYVLRTKAWYQYANIYALRKGQ